MRVQDAVSFPGVDRLDAELLVAEALRKDRTWVIAHPEAAISPKQQRMLRVLLKRRAKGEPLAYILGRKEFYGRTFRVTKDTLIPRPATELLVETTECLLKKNATLFTVAAIDEEIIVAAWIWKKPGSCTIVDIGTGSGCIAVTLKKMFPRRTVIATDISAKALSVAKANAKKLGARIVFKKGNTLDPLKGMKKPFVIVSNPPYIPFGTKLMKDVAGYEPKPALYSGKDGADVIRKILKQAVAHPLCVGVILECRADQLPVIDDISRDRRARPI